MKAFNKKSKVKNSNKRKVSVIKSRDLIKTKEDFDRIIKANKFSSAVFCKDRNGKQIGVWAVIYNCSLDFVSQDVLAEGRLYSAEKEGICGDYYAEYMPVVDGYAVDIDAFPVFRDWVEFPITDVQIVNTSDEVKICELLIKKGMYTIIEPKEKDARYYVKRHNRVSVGFQCKKGRDYFNSEDFTHAMVERGEQTRIDWLKNHDVEVYEVIKRDGDVILEIERI